MDRHFIKIPDASLSEFFSKEVSSIFLFHFVLKLVIFVEQF